MVDACSRSTSFSLFDMLSQIPSYDYEKKTARDDIFDFYKEASWRSRSRLIDKDGQRIDVSTMGFNGRDRFDLLRLMVTPEDHLADKRHRPGFWASFFHFKFLVYVVFHVRVRALAQRHRDAPLYILVSSTNSQ